MKPAGKHVDTHLLPLTLNRAYFFRTGSATLVSMRNKDNRKAAWRLEFKGRIEDFDAGISLDYWKHKSASEKFAEVDKLIHQAQVIKGQTGRDGRELLRSTAVLKRR